jgi:high-affinity iron transporter
VFANLLIGLREGLEAALVVSILVTYLVRVQRRDMLPKLWLGVLSAIVLSLSLGAVLTFGAYGLSFQAQEILGGLLSIAAVGLITWMIFWLAKTSANLKGHLHTSIDNGLVAGGFSIALVAFLAVGREGIETTLFIWAAVQASGETVLPLLGAAIGIAIAVLLGYLVYRGMVKINLATFFRWTGALLITVSAGVLSYGVHDLQEAGLLPGLNALAFNLTTVIPPDSWYGTLLKGIFNFSPATTWLEFLTWWIYIVTVGLLFWRAMRASTPPAPTVPSPSSPPMTSPTESTLVSS